MLVEHDGWADFLRWVESRPVLALDTETTGLRPWHGDVIAGISLSDGEHGFYAPFHHGEGLNHGPKRLRQLLRLLEQTPRLVMFNGTFDLHFLQRAGMAPVTPGRFEEVQVAAHLHNENDFNRYWSTGWGLKELANKYLGPGASRDEGNLRALVAERFGKAKARTKAWKGLMWRLPAALVEPYATADAVLTMHLRNYFARRVLEEGMSPLYRDMCTYTLLLQEMAYRGVQVDRSLCETLERNTRLDAQTYAERLREVTGLPDLNLNSSPQLHSLFGADSVTAQHLRQWMAEGDARAEIADLLLSFRAADKMNSSYFAKYLPLLDERDRLHPSFNVTGTETGRLSCNEPNLQAIPRDVVNHRVKNVFIPAEPEGWLIEMDLSQAEIRLASFYGRERLMAEHLRLGKDIHDETAALIGCDRSTAKRINFSAIYGIGAASYSQKYEVPFEESLRNLEAYHATYPGFRWLYKAAERVAVESHVLRLPNGRRRHYFLPTGRLEDDQMRARIAVANMSLESETRKASSNLVQGMVAAVMMKAMLRIRKEVPLMRMVLTVHDSLLFDLPGGLSESVRTEAIAAARECMEHPAPDDPAFIFEGVPEHPDCPIRVDVKVSNDRWGTAASWEAAG